MYYILEPQHLSLIMHLNEGNGFGVSFLQGKAVQLPSFSTALRIEIESEYCDLPDYFEVDCVPIVNRKVIDCLDAAGVGNMQCIPVNVHFREGVVTDGYFLLNVIGLVNCIDENKTDCSHFGPSIARIFSLTLLDDPAEGKHLFRAKEYHDILFITAPVKRALQSATISGCEIRPAQGWSDAHRF